MSRLLLVWLVSVLTLSCGSLPFFGKTPGDESVIDGEIARGESDGSSVSSDPVALTPPNPTSDASSMEVTRTRVVDPRTANDPAARPDAPAPLSRDQQTPADERPVLPAGLLVGLASDRVTVQVECCQEPVRLFNQSVHHDLESSAVISAWSSDGSGQAAPSLFFLQAAALKDQMQASALATRLAAALGTEADSVFDAQTDLYKVRVGPFTSREGADNFKPRLEQLGYRDPWIVREANAESSVGFVVSIRGGGDRHTVRFEGRHLLIDRPSSTVRFGGSSYRGRLLLFVNDRAQINVINAVGFEDYLRGVVPKELGPDLYPELEALKAQAVAARTYTLKNMGEFLAEGYDICSTPRCQVYGGMSAEHPLSDRAIRETTSEVLVATPPGPSVGTEVVDAMFSASCGGHTENVRSVFPLKDESYLRARPCVERGLDRLSAPGQDSAMASLADTLISALDFLPEVEARRSNDVRGRFQGDLLALAGSAKIVPPRDRLRSIAAAEIRRYLASIFDLFLDRQWFDPTSAAHRSALVDRKTADLARAFAQLAELSPKARVEQPLRGALVVGFARALGLVEFADARMIKASRQGSSLLVAQAAIELKERLPLFVEAAGAVSSRSSIATFPGDPLRLATVQGRPAAIISDSVRHGRSPILAKPWTRFRTRARLQTLISERYPGFRLSSLEVVSRGVSSRVERLDLSSSDGRRESVRGLEVRWILDLPDTWFAVERAHRNGAEGWLFSGRGRGHGVGMCQVGAFGMAVMGVGYQDILEHYYWGARVVNSRVGAARLPWSPSHADPRE